MRVAHIGNSRVRNQIGMFCHDASDSAAAGHFVHGYGSVAHRVNSVRMPENLRAVPGRLL